MFSDPFRLHNANLRYFGRHFEKRPLARVPHISQRLAPSHLIQRPRIYKKTPSILLAPESRTGPQFRTLLYYPVGMPVSEYRNNDDDDNDDDVATMMMMMKGFLA